MSRPTRALEQAGERLGAGQGRRRAQRGPAHVLIAVASVAFALGVVGAGTLGLLSLLARQEVTSSHVLDAAPRRLEILVDGDLTVSPSPDGRVHLEQRSSYSFRPPRVSEIAAGDTLALRARCDWVPGSCRIDYDVQVPMDVLAEIDASATTGDVQARGLRSRRVETHSAAGTVLLSFDAPPERVVADSNARDVTVLVPQGPEGYRVVSAGDQAPNRRAGGAGDIGVRVRVDPASPRLIDASSSGGSVRVDYR